jgi:pyruvate/2-oxoglutarate dehydrogenase complex dihydrolipoamide dehydrogenase (E3) component
LEFVPCQKNPAYDVAVIGSGSAGFAAARTAAGLGARTVVIEAGPQIAGLCILRGCMPSKALLASSNRMHEVQTAAALGILARGKPSLRRIVERKNSLIHEFASYRERQIRTGDFDFIRGRPRFVGRRAVQLASGRQISARNFIVCTGSRVERLPFEGLDAAGSITSDEALNLRKLPKSLIVLGAGPVGLELGQYFSRLGSRVIILQRSRQILSKTDPDVAGALHKALEREGIRIFTDVELLRFEKRGRKSVFFRQRRKLRRIDADEILYALGRVPNTDGLGLEDIGVKLRGAILRVDSTMRSSVPNIFAAGDVNGEHEVVHIAIREGEVAARNAVLGKREKVDRRTRAFAVFTDPEIAAVGPGEGELAGQRILVAKYPFSDHGKSMVMGRTEGFVKVIASARGGAILGAQIVGPHASDLIHEMIALIHMRATAKDLASMPHYHPTLAEILTYPAEEILSKLRSL